MYVIICPGKKLIWGERLKSYMKIALCDDNSIFRNDVRVKVEAYFNSLDIIIDEYESGESLLKALQILSYDLLVLDIEMGGIDGLETAKRIRDGGSDMPIILLTSHTEFAMDGYELGVYRFLAKPVQEDKLFGALDQLVQKMGDEQKVMLRVDGEDIIVKTNDIMYITASNVYLDVVTKDKTYLIRKKLKDMLKELPEDIFMQVHRSNIVNVNYVKSINNTTIVMQDGENISATKQKAADVKMLLMKGMRGR
jgi:two-component system LytT family response regulator